MRSLLPDHDVYVTDWHNARDVGLEHGAFHLDDYIAQVIAYLEYIGPGAHVVAVCQPCPAALAATALMAASGNPCQPKSLTLMAGPVDTRVNPTKVNDLAHSKPLEWFEKNVITTVPLRYPGALRRVYPGFLQVAGFVSMNVERHLRQHVNLYKHLVHGDAEEAALIADFYDEYFAVLDIAAEFYLETIDRVFQREQLAQGQFTWRGQPGRAGGHQAHRSAHGGGGEGRCLWRRTDAGRPGPVHRDQAGQEEAPSPARCRPLRRVQREPLGAPDLPICATSFWPTTRASNSISSSSTSSGWSRAASIHSIISGMVRMVLT